MKIALDYDNTYTLDPHFWNAFIMMSQKSGHTVFVVTHREKDRDSNTELRGIANIYCPVYFTGGVAKRWWCEHWGPGKVDIWIDDKPESVSSNSDFPFDDLQKWREECASKEPGHPGPLPFNHLP
jgi:predicted phosphoadenosine phosphosulfate sulfurtransferase